MGSLRPRGDNVRKLAVSVARLQHKQQGPHAPQMPKVDFFDWKNRCSAGEQCDIDAAFYKKLKGQV